MARAFVIRPFGAKKDSSGTEIDFDRVHNELIGPALHAAGLGGERPARSWTPGTSARTCSR
ncbi:MAG: hypothetical protein MZV70_34875 [Desulfobacterales bacterium]|nr:hypothetical protein [Desulfobacterales bacterium]